MKIACVILAAGDSKRYGENKLLYELEGSPLIDIAISKIPTESFYKVILVSQYDEILNRGNEHNFITVRNSNPELGQSLSIKLGLTEALDADATMFMVSDQPFLSKSSIEKLINSYTNDKQFIYGLATESRNGNPVIFPKVYYDELLELSGDIGGKKVIKNHYDNYKTILVEDIELLDIDTKDDLNKINF